MKQGLSYLILTGILVTVFYACSTITPGAKAVTPFDKNKYLGRWYEIARLDFKYERNLNNVTAEYSLNEDGTIRVSNRGYDTTKRSWKQAIGKAKFVGEENVAMLKVSFFGSFYSGYNVIAIDENYRYALIAGKSLKYLWILSRDKTIPAETKDKYINIARNIGYKTSDLIWVTHH
jgi:apolipoprotein D and lipocalin family protein